MATTPAKLEIEELENEEMYCLFAPDGSWQPSTLSEDFPTCVAFIQLLHKAGMGRSFHQLCTVQGFKILPVKVSMVQNGDENTAFSQKASTLN